MNERVSPRRHGSYGIDAPYGPAIMALYIVVVLALSITSGRWQNLIPTTFPMAMLVWYLHGTLRGKFVIWAGLLDQSSTGLVKICNK